MKFFRKYIFPGLYGLLVYATIRVINDTVSKFKFWQRDWHINAIEITFSIGMGYALQYIIRKLFDRFDRELAGNIGYKTILKELFWVCIISELVVNAVITPMAALTDDGLSWGDLATINIIPLLFCLISYAIMRSNRLLEAYVNNKMQLEMIMNDQLQTELKFLKAQYHPHFLFNALNTIYFQMDEDVLEAKKTVEKFSALLRYQLYDQQQMVSLQQEMEYLQHFIDIQRMRSPERLELSAYFDPALDGREVYPLLFLPLVENAFKYAGGDYRIRIEARMQGDAFLFEVNNSLPEISMPRKQGGIGLENLKRRLELLYPGKHRLELEKMGNEFRAGIQLTLS